MTADDAPLRLFFALPAYDAGVRLRKPHERLDASPREIRAVMPGNYHLTLKFLGAVPRPACERLVAGFSSIDLGSVAPLPFAMRGLGAFPGVARPRVIWCGLELDTAALERMASIIEDLSASHGFARETRPLRPHLTLARVRKEGKAPPWLNGYLASQGSTHYGDSVFDRIVLYRSDLDREGPRYTALAERNLVRAQ